MRIWAGVLAVLTLTGVMAKVTTAQEPLAPSRTNIKTEAQLDEEARQADTLYQQNKQVEALPLYEDLHTQRPKRVFYTERLAMAYVMKGGTETTAEARAVDRAKGRKLLEEARAAGDNSDLAQILSSQMQQEAAAPAAQGPRPVGADILDQAEQMFSKGDLRGATELYAKAWQQNPKLYEAALYAGDAEYKQNHFDEAGVWYQRAIAINPDRETAYRYWADDLTKANQPAEAHKEYVAAFVAEPYARAPRLILKSWATKNGFRYVAPPVVIPVAPAKAQGNNSFTMYVDSSKINDPNYMAWAGYPLVPQIWRGSKFAITYPKETAYRHSLAEESDGIKGVLAGVRANKKFLPEQYDATTRTLLELEKDGMLECWILLDDPDQGIAQDYAAYRETHRDLLMAYVEKYDLHPT